jgi:hypothetical protein
MTTISSSSTSKICAASFGRIGHSCRTYNRMNSAQALALLHGDGVRFAEQIAESRARMEELKYAIIAHEETHGCAPSDGYMM